ncbi:MAG: VWA domain-containing protein [Bacteroidetes bacterium]|nr:VWA domain-containing protein [Bacteroidota bacterium]
MKSLRAIYLRIFLLHTVIWTVLLVLFYVGGGFEPVPLFYFMHPSYLLLLLFFLPLSWIFGKSIFKTNNLNWGKRSPSILSINYALTQLFLGSITWYALVFAAAMPIYGKEKAEATKSNAELIVCLDISKSMNVRDMQGSSRLDVAKRVISSLLTKSSGEKIGLCIFAGNAIREIEPTSDYQLIRAVVSNVESELIEQQGTDIGAAFKQSNEMFSFRVNNKSVLLITDGENHEADDRDKIIYKGLISKNVRTCVLGLGTGQGGPIPSTTSEMDASNLVDDNGNEWISKLDEESIKQIATATGGSAIISSAAYPDIEQILTQINLMKGENSRTLDVDVDAMQYKWFVYTSLVAFCMLLLLPVLWRK